MGGFPELRIDHVIVAAPDLQATAERVQRALGREVVAGGRHDGLGTQNMIVPLRGGFIEILAVVDPAEAAQSELGRLLCARIARTGDGLLAWAVAVDDVEAVAARLRLTASAVGRGGRTAALAGLPEALRTPTLPFFIERRGEPVAAEPDQPAIDWLELGGDGDLLSAWLGGSTLPVRVTDGEPAVHSVSAGGRTLT